MITTISPALVLRRMHQGPEATLGQLWLHGQLLCHTLEDPVRTGAKVPGSTAIPSGTYGLHLRHSPAFSHHYSLQQGQLQPWQPGQQPHLCVGLRAVPGFSHILLHWGNTPAHTRGCILVGESWGKLQGQPAVLHSRQAYCRVYPQLLAMLAAGQHWLLVA